MFALVIVLILLWVIAGLIGVFIKGLIWLTIVAAILFVLTLIFGGTRLGRRKTNR